MKIIMRTHMRISFIHMLMFMVRSGLSKKEANSF